VRLLYHFFKRIIKRFYRRVFGIKLKSMTEKEGIESVKMLKNFLEDIEPAINKIKAIEEYKKIKKNGQK